MLCGGSSWCCEEEVAGVVWRKYLVLCEEVAGLVWRKCGHWSRYRPTCVAPAVVAIGSTAGLYCSRQGVDSDGNSWFILQP